MEKTINSRMIRYREAAKLVGLAYQTLRHMVSAGTIPHYHIGKTVCFDEQELWNWAKTNKGAGNFERRKGTPEQNH